MSMTVTMTLCQVLGEEGLKVLYDLAESLAGQPGLGTGKAEDGRMWGWVHRVSQQTLA